MQLNVQKAFQLINSLNKFFEKNLGIQAVLKISHKMSREEITIDDPPEDYSNDDLIYFKRAPLSSVDVERELLGVRKHVGQ